MGQGNDMTRPSNVEARENFELGGKLMSISDTHAKSTRNV